MFELSNRFRSGAGSLLSVSIPWLFYLVIRTTQGIADHERYRLLHLGSRLQICLIGILLTGVMVPVLKDIERTRLAPRILIALGASLVSSTIMGLIDCIGGFEAFSVSLAGAGAHLVPWIAQHPSNAVLTSTLSFCPFFVGWTMASTVVSLAARNALADRQAILYKEQAKAAQLQALRYQLNPHFLFNILNSLSTLVLQGETETADRIIGDLSILLRTMIVEHTTDDTTLGDELAIQKIYLGLEQIRFPGRILLSFDLADDVADSRIPSLLLQPIFENTIKYAVSGSSVPIHISTRVRREEGFLLVEIRDDGATLEGVRSAGAGIGLRNVRERLLTRFGSDASCIHGRDGSNGFGVALRFPRVTGRDPS